MVGNFGSEWLFISKSDNCFFCFLKILPWFSRIAITGIRSVEQHPWSLHFIGQRIYFPNWSEEIWKRWRSNWSYNPSPNLVSPRHHIMLVYPIAREILLSQIEWWVYARYCFLKFKSLMLKMETFCKFALLWVTFPVVYSQMTHFELVWTNIVIISSS
jgi:hypothetical protein